MILIADSGSTKTEWALIKEDKSVINFKTIGLNPVFVSTQDVVNELKSTKLNNYLTEVKQVYFFGAGCSTESRQSVILKALNELFINSKIKVDSDLLGAGLSQFGNSKGIIGILGTGSNTGIYNNGEIIENISSLGYILGDEGSGAVIGKAFIKLFLNNELTEDIRLKFSKKYDINIDTIITKVYKEPFPNRFLASFMPFIYDNKNDEIVENMLYNSFAEFFEKTICKYNNYQSYQLKLIGSIAFYFSDIIGDICISKGINFVSVSQSPLKALVKYYSN